MILPSILLLVAFPQAVARPPASEAPDAAALRERLPFELFLGTPVVPLRLQGSPPVRAILDTGMPSGVFVFDPALGERLGLDYVGTANVTSGGPATRPARIALGALAELGSLAFPDQRVIVLGERHEIADSGVEAVLGESAFRSHVVELDFEAGTVSFLDPERFDPAGAGAELPLTLVGEKPFVDLEVAVRDEPATRVRLLVDTGASTTLSLQRDGRARWSVPTGGVECVLSTGMSGDVRGRRARVASLALGPHRLEQVVADFPEPRDGPGPDDGGTLGTGVLRRFRVTIDYPRQRMFLAPNARFAEPFEANMAGLGLRGFDGLGLRVHSLVPGSPADEAGLRAGDRVLAIDGRPVGELGHAEVERAFSRPGRTLLLLVERAGERQELRVALERLL